MYLQRLSDSFHRPWLFLGSNRFESFTKGSNREWVSWADYTSICSTFSFVLIFLTSLHGYGVHWALKVNLFFAFFKCRVILTISIPVIPIGIQALFKSLNQLALLNNKIRLFRVSSQYFDMWFYLNCLNLWVYLNCFLKSYSITLQKCRSNLTTDPPSPPRFVHTTECQTHASSFMLTASWLKFPLRRYTTSVTTLPVTTTKEIKRKKEKIAVFLYTVQ